jgi:methyl-accepting chemotaxis protein
MTPSSHSTFWSRLHVGPRITLISAVFLAGLIAIVAFTVSAMEDQEADAIAIELAGRQRMLQKQHIVQTLLLAQKRAQREDLEYTRKVWTGTQEALISGGPAVARMGRSDLVTLPPPGSDALRGKLEEQFQAIRDAIRLSDAMLAATPQSPEYEALLTQMTDLDQRMQTLGIENAKAITANQLNKVRSLVRAEIAIGVMVGLIGLLVGWMIGREISVPLQQVVNSAESISQGNLRINKLGLMRGDEVGQLARAFDHMLDNLKDLSGQIIGVTGNVNSATAEILASTQQQASSTKEQAATVQEITTTMQEISQSGKEITDRARQVAASAEATSAASNNGITAVQNTNRLMESIRQQVEEVAVKIVALSEKTQAIGEIVGTVNDIAEQTNLLALNASIEAAAAGEQGNRFSVVASEMRNLAERSKESTVQVGSILSEIQKGINSSVMLAEEAVKRSESGKQQAEVTEKTIHQMMQTTVDSINAFQQIIGATSQQQIGFDQVAQGMRDIRQAAEQTAVGTSQLEQALANLNELSRQLRTAVGRYQV